ncbi:hypothetical protein DFH27DRAFT_576255 [Peziza echinospora]|nr:hypothetical protein DFH27DRAFT_576255 [Peziza echinospora]
MNPPPPPPLPKISRIAILGGGPSGLTCLARLLRFRPPHFPTIHLFEQRPVPGGVWNSTPHLTHSISTHPTLTIPLSSPVSEGAALQDARHEGEFVSAIYPGLVANIPKQLMGFHDFPFGEEVELFPGHEAVRDYIHAYAQKVEKEAGSGSIFYGKKVQKVQKLHDGGWDVEVVDIDSGEVWDGKQNPLINDWKGEETQVGGRYDAVVVAGGRYTVPYVPNIPGLREFVERGLGRVEHARDFRGGEEFVGKTIIIIGSSVSAGDILRLLLSTTNTNTNTNTGSTKIYQSTRQPLPATSVPANVHLLPQISHLGFPTTTNDTDGDGDGAPPIANLYFLHDKHEPLALPKDTVLLFCTGYLLTAPYLNIDPLPVVVDQEPEDDDDDDATPARSHSPISADGTHVRSLLLHHIYAPDPTLAFLGLPFKVIPFVVSALQGAVLGRVWSGRVGLGELRDGGEGVGLGVGLGVGGDGDDARTALTEEQGKKVHLFGYPKDADYVDMLSGICRRADEREERKEVEAAQDAESDESAPTPPPPSSSSPSTRYRGDYPTWSKRDRWLRKSATGEIRNRFLTYKSGSGGASFPSSSPQRRPSSSVSVLGTPTPYQTPSMSRDPSTLTLQESVVSGGGGAGEDTIPPPPPPQDRKRSRSHEEDFGFGFGWNSSAGDTTTTTTTTIAEHITNPESSNHNRDGDTTTSTQQIQLQQLQDPDLIPFASLSLTNSPAQPPTDRPTKTPISIARKMSVPTASLSGSFNNNNNNGNGNLAPATMIITRVEQLGIWFDKERWDEEERERGRRVAEKQKEKEKEEEEEEGVVGKDEGDGEGGETCGSPGNGGG